MDTSALIVVERHLASCLPHDVPPVHRAVQSAKQVRRGSDTAIYRADLVMFDGLPATVEVSVAGDESVRSESHRWTVMEGGAASFEDGRWQRIREAA